MRTYYSQHGEDYILWALFAEQTSGYFVEVGALDGMRFSNTYSFERAGWRGVCVEAHPDYIEIIQRNRPNSHVIFAAAGDENKDVTFYTNARGSLSTLDASQEEEYKQEHGEYFTGFKPVVVAMRTLDDILAEVGAPAPLDVVSIDVEAAEMLVLRGFDLAGYRPRVLVIEATTKPFIRELDNYLGQYGYRRARIHHSNVFYCLDPEDVKRLRELSGKVTVTHTPHPLDDTQHEQREFSIAHETRSPKAFLKRLIPEAFRKEGRARAKQRK